LHCSPLWGGVLRAYDFSYTYQENTLYYSITSLSTVEVTSGHYVSGNVIIPSQVTYNGTNYSVTSIGNEAFSWCSSLTNITIPNSVTSIDVDAFRKCSSLTSITIPNSVTSIGCGAFSDCSSLTSITIPDSITSINDTTFWNCSSLTSITIPNSVTSIEDQAFIGCSSLTSIEIPNSVTSIGCGAFFGCSSLTSIEIPNSVTKLGGNNYGYFSTGGVFYNCYSLTSVTLSNSIDFIYNYTFYGCSSLTSIIIPNSVTSIGDYAFRGCSSLTSIEIPNSVTSIGYNAFYGCSSLDTIIINSNSTCSSFWSSYLTRPRVLIIGEPITFIEEEAFYYDNSIDTMIFRSEIPPTINGNNALTGNVLLVPCSAIDTYKNSTYYHNHFGNNVYSYDTLWHKINTAIYKNGSYDFNGTILTNAGTYFYTLRNAKGCDSTVVLTLNTIATINSDASQTYATLTAIFATDSEVNTRGLIFNDSIIATGNSDTLITIIDNLTPNTTYTCRPFVITTNNDTLFGNDQTFTTLDVIPNATDATETNKTFATLNGNINFDSIELSKVNKMGFIFNRNTSKDTLLISPISNSFSYIVNNLDSNTTYSYQTFVTAYDTIYLSETSTFKTLAFEKDNEVFEIYTKEDLDLVAYFVNEVENSNEYTMYAKGKYRLMNDIVLDTNQTNNITAIGSLTRPFSGYFDGNDHIIYNVNIEKLNDTCQGLFGYTKDAGIYNLGIANINVVSKRYTGGMVGFAENTYIKNCYVQGGKLYATSYSGGLIGYQSAGDSSVISSCYNTCTVEGNNYLGGLLGYSNNGVVRNSYVAAPIIAHGDLGIGAIIGGAIDVLTYNFYFSTAITGQTKAVGTFDGLKSVNGKAGEGLDDEMMQSDEFVDLLNANIPIATWKHDYDVEINGGFPILVWQDGIEVTLTTEEAEQVTENSAILKATLTADTETLSQVTKRGFVYRENTANSAETWQKVIVDSDEFEYSLTDLNDNTPYIYQAFVVIQEDTAWGGEKIFTTLKDVSIKDVISTEEDNLIVNIYPNPADKEVYLTLNNTDLGNAKAVIYDLQGKVVKVFEIKENENNVKLDVSALQKGTYTIMISNEKTRVTKKLIKR
jgi:hypothetical protein